MDLRKLSRQLASESMIYGIAGVLTKFISVFVVPIYTRIFSPEDYGRMGVVNTTYQLLAAVVVLGLDSAASRWYWETDDDEQRKRVMSTWFFTQMAFSIIVTAIAIIMAYPLSSLFFKNGDEARLFVISVLALPLATYTVVFSKYLRFKRKPIQSVVFSVTTNVLNVGAAIFFVLEVKLGIAGFFVASLISKTVAATWAGIALRDRISRKRYSPKLLKDMLRYSVPMLPTIVGAWLINQVSVYFLNFTRSTAEVGLYQIGSTIASISAMFYASFQQAWGPFAFSIEKNTGARKMYALTLFLYMSFGGAVAFLNGLYGKELLALFTTRAYAASSLTVAILSFAFISQGVLSIAALGCNMAKKNGPIGIGVIIGAFVSIALNAILDPWIGKEGAAISLLTSQIVYSGFVFYKSGRLYQIPYPFLSSYSIFFILFFAAIVGSICDSVYLKITLTALLLFLVFLFKNPIKNRIRAILDN